jgi:hypothetical protein
MALAFRRAVEEAQKAITAANANIKSSYKVSSDASLVVDFDGIKAVDGVSKQNPNSVEGPKNITLVNWVKDNTDRFKGIWGDVQYKDKAALPILVQHLDKVVIHVDDKSNGKKYNSYDAKFEGKDLHVTVHIDFDNYPQSLSLTDEKNGVHIDYFVWDHLNDVANVAFQVEKTRFESSSDWTGAQKSINDKAKKDIKLVIHWDDLIKLPGKALEAQNRPPVPINYYAIKYLTDGRGLNGTVQSVLALCKDQMGVEAFVETFDSIHINIVGNSKENRSGPHKVTKQGKELHFTYDINFVNGGSLQNAQPDSSKLAKDIEALL